MARIADSVVDTVLGEAGGRTRSQRYADMRAVASVISNRSTLLGVTPQAVVSAPGQFSAYGKSLPPGVEAYRDLAEQAIESVAKWGPSHVATFYATPEAVPNLPRGLTPVTSTVAHTYFDDPQNRAITVGSNRARRPSQTEKETLANLTGYANEMDATYGPMVDTATARLADQDRAAAIAAQDMQARTAPIAPTADAVSSIGSFSPAPAVANAAPAAAQVSAPAASIDAGSMPNVSISKTSRMSAPAATTAPAATQRSPVSAPSVADARSAATAQARDSLNAQRAQYSGPDAQAAPSTAGNTVSRSAAMSSGFSSAAGASKGSGTTGGGGWGDDNGNGGFFGGLMDSISGALSSPVGAGANLTGKTSAPSVSATATGGPVGSTAGQGATASANLGRMPASTTAERQAAYAAAKEGWANELNAKTALGTANLSPLDGYPTQTKSRWGAMPATVDDATVAVQAPPATAVDAIDSIAPPSYEVPDAAMAYAPTRSVSKPSAPSANAGATTSPTAASRAADNLSAYNASLDADRPGQMKAAADAARSKKGGTVSAPSANSFGLNIGPKAATMAGSMLGSMFGGPVGGFLGAIAGNMLATNTSRQSGGVSAPAGGSGGLFGGTFGRSDSGDGLGGAGPGGRGPAGNGGRGPGGSGQGSRSNSGGGSSGGHEQGRRN